MTQQKALSPKVPHSSITFCIFVTFSAIELSWANWFLFRRDDRMHNLAISRKKYMCVNVSQDLPETNMGRGDSVNSSHILCVDHSIIQVQICTCNSRIPSHMRHNQWAAFFETSFLLSGCHSLVATKQKQVEKIRAL